MFLGFPGDSAGKESTCSVGDLGSIPGLGRSPEGGRGNPLQYSCLENPHGQRSLAGYSEWGHKESDMTEQLSTAQEYSLVDGGTYLEPGLLVLSPSSLHAACFKLGALAFIQWRAQGGGGSSWGGCWRAHCTLQSWKLSWSMQIMNTCIVLIPQGNSSQSTEPSEWGHMISKDYFIKGLFLSSFFWRNGMPSVPLHVVLLSFHSCSSEPSLKGSRKKREQTFISALKSVGKVFSWTENWVRSSRACLYSWASDVSSLPTWKNLLFTLHSYVP